MIGKMIKTIIFDLGGVLIDLDIVACIRACREELGFDKAAELLDPCHQKGIFQRLEAGEVSPEEFAAEVLKMCRPGTSVEQLARAFRKLLLGVDPRKVELLKELGEKYDLYLLSNNNEISMASSKKMFEDLGIPMDKMFKKLFLSYEMHLLKPSDEIYQEVIRQIGGEPSEMLFVDDSQINVDAAIRNGMQSICYKPGTCLGTALSDVLYD